MPIFWSSQDQSLLMETDVYESLKSVESLLEEYYETSVKTFCQMHSAILPEPSFLDFKKAMSLVSSRAFQVDDYHGDAFVPLAGRL